VLIVEIAIGIVLGFLILANLDSILPAILFLAALAIVLILAVGAFYLICNYPESAIFWSAIILLYVAKAYWDDWMSWLQKKAFYWGESVGKFKRKVQSNGLKKTLFASTEEKVKSKRREKGYRE
jgi:hypothetical protein